MTVLVDTNVLLDVALGRHPFFEAAVRSLRHCRRYHQTLVAWHTLPTLYYLMLRNKTCEAGARQFCRDLTAWARVADANHASVLAALDSPLKDFEDALQAAAADAAGADVIQTRNVKDFEGSPVRAVTPDAFDSTSLA
jgi:predicted nucleic acid-binding protein